MNRYSTNKALFATLFVAAIIVSSLAWQNKPAPLSHHNGDTVPVSDKKIRNIDDALQQLDRADIDLNISNPDWDRIKTDIAESIKNIHINEAAVKAQVAQAMSQVNAAKIQAQIQTTLSQIDMNQIQADVQKSLAAIDMEKIKADVAASLKEIDMNKLNSEVNASLRSIDWNKINAQIDEAKNIDLDKLEKELHNMRPDIEKSIKIAHADIDKAKKELSGYKELIDGLDKDGVINKKEAYKIRYTNGELFINNHKQSQEITKKYSHILAGHKDFTITSNSDDFNIQNE